MSLEGDTADKMVREGLEVTETAVKLAGLGPRTWPPCFWRFCATT